MRVKLSKWGNSLAVRIPKDLAESAGLSDGQELEAEAIGGVVSLRPARRRYTIEELFAGVGPATEPPELVDWGEDRGSERLPDDDYTEGLITEDDLLRKRVDRRGR